MSYRALRNLCEMTRALGYPRQLSVENFRTPNFKLVAELLEWIVKRFEPNASLSAQQIGTEQERVMFVKQAVLLMLQNSRLKLNPRKLYQADGNAVQELLPAIRVLYNAAKQLSADDMHSQWNSLKSSISQKMQDVRIARQLSSQLPQTAAALHDLIEKEFYYRKQRNSATARAVPLSEAERSLQQAIVAINEETQEIANKLNNVANDEASLDEKIERKKREYEQMQKRYAKLQAFRPQYMDEYEKYEKKLQERYEIYVLQYRNLTYLQQLQMEIERSEKNKQSEAERNMRSVVEKMRSEQKDNIPVDELDEEEIPPITHERRSSRRVFGNMTGAGISDDEDDEEDDDGADMNETQAQVLIQSDLSDDGELPPDVIDHNPDKNELSSGDDF